MFDYYKYQERLQEDQKAYREAAIFPHIVFDNFLSAEAIEKATDEFPAMSEPGWIHYQHINENKQGLTKRHAMPETLGSLIDELNSPRFVDWLSSLTGIPGLIADPALEGGGLHQLGRGGFLNIHADFTVHPHHRMWQRRVNVLIYLNREWKEEYGGQLELWTKDMKSSFEKILPLYNRCVIFNTDHDSFHGHPHPLLCPEDMTRKSIALYYFTQEKAMPQKIATNYRAQPGDGLKAIAIYLDKKILAAYNVFKGVLGINDDIASKMLKWFGHLCRLMQAKK